MNINIPFKIDGAEFSWFAPLCDGDDDFLGNRNSAYKSSWENTSSIVKTADQLGYRNILCPSSYQVGQDTLAFVAGMAPLTKQINFLAAVRCGELHPPMLARSIATLDHMLKGRLTINIISSDLPGTKLNSNQRYARSREVIEILKQAWKQDQIDFQGDYYKFKLPWRIETPKGYSTLFFQPYYNFTKDFSIMPFILDTDLYDLSNLEFPCIIKNEVDIKPGQPLVQFIPFKRDSWTHSLHLGKEETSSKMNFFLFDMYKRAFHQKKTFK